MEVLVKLSLRSDFFNCEKYIIITLFVYPQLINLHNNLSLIFKPV